MAKGVAVGALFSFVKMKRVESSQRADLTILHDKGGTFHLGYRSGKGGGGVSGVWASGVCGVGDGDKGGRG